MYESAPLLQSYADLYGLNDLDGHCATAIPGVHFYRAKGGGGRQPLLYRSGIIMVGQGTKEIHLGEECVRYGPGNYLVVGVPLPLECEAFADEGKPILGLSINVPKQLLHRLVNEVTEHSSRQTNSDESSLGLTSESMNSQLNNAFLRLLYTLHDEQEAKILGPSIAEEIIYRILVGANGRVLFDLARHDGQYARVAKTLNYLHKEFAGNITVEHLAEHANMSVSGFHRAFRQVTTESPLQYLKKVRLEKARELISSKKCRTSDAATSVGYNSVSQFSREFKRHFNITPRALATAS